MVPSARGSQPNRMTNLLDSVLDAHGGLDRWLRLKRFTADMVFGGPFWAGRGWPELAGRARVMLDPRREHIELEPCVAGFHKAVFDVDPERVSLFAADGAAVERSIPRASFPMPFDPKATRWDAIEVAYFMGTANWNYLTEPFLFTYPGVEANEIEPWDEHGETWRRLAVHFPPTLPNHNPSQIFYYDARFMLRRMDYAPDVTGHSPIAHYTHDPKTFDGFVFPTRRLVHFHDAAGVVNQAFSSITIDVASVQLEM
jgi:hypothetical protein